MIAFLLLHRGAPVSSPAYHLLTYRRGTIRMARFAPDGQTVVYSAAWEGGPVEIFSTRFGTPESRPVGVPGSRDSGHFFHRRDGRPVAQPAKQVPGLHRHLARMPLGGGAPREILENIQWADWSPDGSQLAIVRDVNGRNRLEYPPGKVLYETGGWISHPRISRKGDMIAFIDHSIPGRFHRKRGAVVDMNGKKRTLSQSYGGGAVGLAWSPERRRSLGYGDCDRYRPFRVCRPACPAKERLVARVPADLTLQDVLPDGRALLARDSWRRGLIVRRADDSTEHDFTWLDWSYPVTLSADGQTLLFREEGEAGGPTYAVYLRKTDGSPAVRLGDGLSLALSPDGKWALVHVGAINRPICSCCPPDRASLGRCRGTTSFTALPAGFPDGKTDSGIWHGDRITDLRLYVQDIDVDKIDSRYPRGNERTFRSRCRPMASSIAAVGPGRQGLSLPGSFRRSSVPIKGLQPGEVPVAWTADGRSLYVYRGGELAIQGLPVWRSPLAIAFCGKSSCRLIRPASSSSVQCFRRPTANPTCTATAACCPISTSSKACSNSAGFEA